MYGSAVTYCIYCVMYGVECVILPYKVWVIFFNIGLVVPVVVNPYSTWAWWFPDVEFSYSKLAVGCVRLVWFNPENNFVN